MISNLFKYATDVVLSKGTLQKEVNELKQQLETVLKTKQESRPVNAVEQRKEQANAQKKAWVEVVNTNVNPADIRYGFFEIDWNSYFIKELIAAGFGTAYDPEEEIVDRWFRSLIQGMSDAENMPSEFVHSGSLDLRNIMKGNE